ncbi:hypothetical protein Cgig2_030559 [Carnegiea gigantea]|uniref:Ionotropic glutamate receptor C-terminal domain-containing protein n=1 Tax=Carnegiea gigantea TaxID=171969 RepID=A0A9Q1JM30_9CARY|nr:hypothetical protein Cgig2_030559 [Carnegiea gigantea]
MKHNKRIKDRISCSVMISALALVDMLPSSISVAMGQTHSNDTSSLTLALTTNCDNQTPASTTKRLRIAVPVRGFSDFVKVTSNNVTGKRNVGGFAAEVFNTVVNTVLIKPFPFEIVPFAKPDGTPNGRNFEISNTDKAGDGTVLHGVAACYAAIQTSSLSETPRRPPIKNINQLIRTRANVGCQQGSFIKNLLAGKGLLESQLVGFNTSQEMNDLLSQGSVAAVVGLTPHLQLRQAGKYDTLALVQTFSLQAAGFGFAFRIGSTEVRDMSNGILKLICNGQMRRIQERTIGSLETCQDDQNDGHSSDLIDTDTLWILVAGAIGVLLLMIIVMMVQCGMTCAASRKEKKALADPCYVLPC